MPKKYTKEEKIKIVESYSKCCSVKDREELAKKYGYKSIYSLKSSIDLFNKQMGIKPKITRTSQEANKLSDDEKIKLVNEWNSSSKEEKEEIAKKYNTTYQRMASVISVFRKLFGFKKVINRFRTDEEKIKILEEYNAAKNKKEREELAEKYGIKYDSIGKSVSMYRREFNICEYSSIRYSDEDKLVRIKEWDNANIEGKKILAKKYNYKDMHSARNRINAFKKELAEKGLI